MSGTWQRLWQFIESGTWHTLCHVILTLNLGGGLLLFPLYWWVNWVTKRIRNLPKMTQLKYFFLNLYFWGQINSLCFFKIFIYLFIWWHRVLVVASGLLSCSMQTLSCSTHVGSSSLTRDRTQALCIGSAESYPLCHRGSWKILILNCLSPKPISLGVMLV